MDNAFQIFSNLLVVSVIVDKGGRQPSYTVGATYFSGQRRKFHDCFLRGWCGSGVGMFSQSCELKCSIFFNLCGNF